MLQSKPHPNSCHYPLINYLGLTTASPPTTKTTFKVTKPANNLTLQLKDSSEATAKSKSLPRGLPSDESAFNQFQGPPASLQTASETTLEPKQPQVIYIDLHLAHQIQQPIPKLLRIITNFPINQIVPDEIKSSNK